MKRSLRDILQGAVEESPGVISSTRVQMLLVAFAVVLLLLALGGAVALGKIPDIPGGVISLCTLLFAGAGTAKVIQQRNE